MPRGFRSNRRVSTVLSQQIKALEQIRNSQRQFYSQETEGLENERPTEILPMKPLELADPASLSHYNYKIDSDQIWSEDFRVNFSNSKVLIGGAENQSTANLNS